MVHDVLHYVGDFEIVKSDNPNIYFVVVLGI